MVSSKLFINPAAKQTTELGTQISLFDFCIMTIRLKRTVSATALFLFTSGDNKLNCLKEAPKNT